MMSAIRGLCGIAADADGSTCVPYSYMEAHAEDNRVYGTGIVYCGTSVWYKMRFAGVYVNIACADKAQAPEWAAVSTVDEPVYFEGQADVSYEEGRTFNFVVRERGVEGRLWKFCRAYMDEIGREGIFQRLLPYLYLPSQSIEYDNDQYPSTPAVGTFGLSVDALVENGRDRLLLEHAEVLSLLNNAVYIPDQDALPSTDSEALIPAYDSALLTAYEHAQPARFLDRADLSPEMEYKIPYCVNTYVCFHWSNGTPWAYMCHEEGFHSGSPPYDTLDVPLYGQIVVDASDSAFCYAACERICDNRRRRRRYDSAISADTFDVTQAPDGSGGLVLSRATLLVLSWPAYAIARMVLIYQQAHPELRVVLISTEDAYMRATYGDVCFADVVCVLADVFYHRGGSSLVYRDLQRHPATVSTWVRDESLVFLQDGYAEDAPVLWTRICWREAWLGGGSDWTPRRAHLRDTLPCTRNGFMVRYSDADEHAPSDEHLIDLVCAKRQYAHLPVESPQKYAVAHSSYGSWTAGASYDKHPAWMDTTPAACWLGSAHDRCPFPYRLTVDATIYHIDLPPYLAERWDTVYPERGVDRRGFREDADLDLPVPWYTWFIISPSTSSEMYARAPNVKTYLSDLLTTYTRPTDGADVDERSCQTRVCRLRAILDGLRDVDETDGTNRAFERVLEITGETRCSICYTSFPAVTGARGVLTPCGHVYCDFCIDRLVRYAAANRNPVSGRVYAAQCPLCACKLWLHCAYRFALDPFPLSGKKMVGTGGHMQRIAEPQPKMRGLVNYLKRRLHRSRLPLVIYMARGLERADANEEFDDDDGNAQYVVGMESTHQGYVVYDATRAKQRGLDANDLIDDVWMPFMDAVASGNGKCILLMDDTAGIADYTSIPWPPELWRRTRLDVLLLGPPRPPFRSGKPYAIHAGRFVNRLFAGFVPREIVLFVYKQTPEPLQADMWIKAYADMLCGSRVHLRVAKFTSDEMFA